MPTYDYVCDGCGHELVEFQSITADRLTRCPECGEEQLRRRIGAGAGIIFKGSGFYETDYKRTRSGDGSGNKGEDKSSGDKSSEGGGSDSSSDSSSSSKNGSKSDSASGSGSDSGSGSKSGSSS